MPNPIKLQAVVTNVIPYGEGVFHVVLHPIDRVPRYKAGQFLHLSVDEYDPAGGFWPESRVFSIASSPESDSISIVYSVKGRYTKKMEECLQKGTSVWLKMPYGEFVINSSIKMNQDVVLIAGGTGISPFVPYLEELSSCGGGGGAVSLFYGARLRQYILFSELISRCTNEVKGFSAYIQIENESPQGLFIPNARIREGRLSISTVLEETKSLQNPVFFISGPPQMINAFKQQLNDAGIAAENIKYDEWE